MRQIVYIFLFLIFLIEPIIKVWFPNQTFMIPYLLGCTGTLILCCSLLGKYSNHQQWEISWVDVLLVIILAYNLPDILKYGYLPNVILFSTIYLSTKQITNELKIAYIFTVSGCLQVLFMFLQYCKLIPITSETFPITGSLDNPGPLGGYLSLCLVATIAYFNHINHWIGTICVLLLGVGLIISDSRAAWLAAIIASLYILLLKKRIKPIIQIGVFCSIILLFGIFSLSIYKTNSAKGRLMIWEVCVNMIKEHPIHGQGFGSFQREYMYYQADHLNQNENSEMIQTATNNRFAFNDFLQITCEQGIIGIGLITAILALLFIRQFREKEKCMLFPVLFAFVVFATFSYPCEVTLLSMALALLLGTLPAPVFRNIFVNLKLIYTKILICLITLLISTILLNKGLKRTRLEEACFLFLYEDDYKSLEYIRRHFSEEENTTDFVMFYAHSLHLKGEHEIGIPILQRAISLYPTTEKYCDLGDMFQSLGKNAQAEQAYLDAIYLLPNRVYPLFCLFQLHKDTNQHVKAIEIACRIIRFKPKIENQHAKEMKDIAEKYLVLHPIIGDKVE